MKKRVLFGVGLVLLTVLLTSCTSILALGSALETKGEAYVLTKSDDIYGHHETEAILVDKQSEGLATEFYDVRFLKTSTNGVVEDYGVQFRRTNQKGLFQRSLFSEALDVDKVIRVNGVNYILSDKHNLSNQEDIISGTPTVSMMEFRFSDELVNALKNAETISVQYYEKSNKVKLIDIDAKYMEAIREFFK